MNRTFAVISLNKECDKNVVNTVSKLKLVPDSDVIVFSDDHGIDGLETIVWPKELDNEPKIRNWINTRFKDNGFSGFLHVISDMTEVLKDPTEFVADIEKMMKILDYDLWFNTACDPLNYVYAKYTPRMSLDIDRQDVIDKTGICKKIHVTSHSNTQWMIYNFGKLADSDLIKLDESFSIEMFYIVELLSRRRNTAPKGSLYFMNQYFTVGSEPGTFRNYRIRLNKKETEDLVKAENAIWQSKKINFRPDYNVDRLLEIFWEKLVEKTGIPGIL